MTWTIAWPMESWLPNFGNNRPVRPVKWNAPFTFALHRSSTLVLLVLWHSVWSAMHRTASLAPPHGPRRRVAPAGAGFSAQGGRDIFTTHPTHLTPPRSHLLQGSIVWLLQLLPCGTWKSEIFNRVKGSKFVVNISNTKSGHVEYLLNRRWNMIFVSK